MNIITSVNEFSKAIGELKRAGKSIGFVPTMGALHRGHRSLVEKAAAENDVCVVSIFVNPTQFNNPRDLASYPRTLERDAALLESAGCDLLFAPEAREIYSGEEINAVFDFDFGGLDRVMEGKFRPGHFNGVVQIVSKLFRLAQPGKAYFGEKDFQQLAIIHRMVKVMNFDVEIVDCPIIREPDGLAMSSRNERLTPEQRRNAAGISKVLFESVTFAGQKTPQELSVWIADNINAIPGLEVEYVEIADAETLQTLPDWKRPAVICVAVFCGEVRLIDNIKK
jgi:pantoate--beta-alanine ligase